MPAGALTPAPTATASVAAAAVPAWFGKVSVLGDFAHRRLAPDLVRRLDAWLAGWVAGSRRRLGDRWQDAYLTAPVLRFSWAPGALGATGWTGVLMPSCDSAGRYFPLWLAAPCLAVPEAAGDRPWLDDLAATAAATLDAGASIGGFEQDLFDLRRRNEFAPAVPLAADRPPPPAALSQWWVQADDGVEVSSLAALPEEGVLTALWFGDPGD